MKLTKYISCNCIFLQLHNIAVQNLSRHTFFGILFTSTWTCFNIILICIIIYKVHWHSPHYIHYSIQYTAKSTKNMLVLGRGTVGELNLGWMVLKLWITCCSIFPFQKFGASNSCLWPHQGFQIFFKCTSNSSRGTFYQNLKNFH